MLFPQSFIDDLRLQANIVQVVQEYVPLKRAGATYKGLCPFHSEKTPSFHVNPDKGFFHCFGCAAGGDVFKFLELHEKVGFQDAVRMLAHKFGVSLPEASEGTSDDGRRDAALREELLKVHEVAAAYFQEQLAGAAGVRARQQLADRGLNQATINQLALGYAPPARDALFNRLIKHGFSQGLLSQSGVVVHRESGEVIDRFRNRIIVPISRDTGSIIAFGGRSMDADQVPKYLNSPETAIYSKGRTLYGLHLTKDAIRKLGYAVLVEGYFDFAQVFQSEAAPVVASCGTALTSQQAQLLRRFTSKIVLSFDPDAAGQGAAARSCELLVKEGFDVNVIRLDRGEDPDTFIRRKGPDQYRAKLRTSRPYLEYVAQSGTAGLDLKSGPGRKQYFAAMQAFAQHLPDQTSKQMFADKVAARLEITDAEVLAQFRASFRGRRTAEPAIFQNFADLKDLKKAEKDLIWALVHKPAEALTAMRELDDYDLGALAAREIFIMARSLQNQSSELLPSTLLQRLSTVDAQLVTSIAATPGEPAQPAGCVRALKRLRWEREGAAIQREIDRLQQLGATQYGNEIDDLWQRKKDLLHRIEDLT